MGSVDEDPLVQAAMEALAVEPAEALSKAEDALSRAKGRGDARAAGQALQAMATIQAAMGQPGKAASSAEDALKEFRAAGDKLGEVVALQQVISMYIAQGEPERASAKAIQETTAFKGKDATGEMAGLVMQAEASMAREGWEEATASAQAALELYQKSRPREPAAVAALVRLSAAFAALQKPDDAAKAAEEAVAVSAGASKRAQAEALTQLAAAHMAQEKPELALAKVDQALAVADDAAAKREALQAKISIYIASKQQPEARAAARQAARALRDAKDQRGEAAALLLLADVCVATSELGEAAGAANAALELYRALDSKAGQAAALLALATADFDREDGKAIWAARERAKLLGEAGQRLQEAEATLLLADAHVARLGKKLAVCSVPSVEDTMGGLEAARDAHGLFGDVGSVAGQEGAMRAMSRVLLYNNVPPGVVESARSPGEVFNDVLSGRYSLSTNAFPMVKPGIKANAKIDDIVPSAKQLDRSKFAWTNPMAGLAYALVWQPQKERPAKARQARGSYDITGLVTGSRATALPALYQARSNIAAEKEDPLAVYILSTDCRDVTGTTNINMLNVVGAMILAKLPRLTFVMLDESFYEDMSTYTRARTCALYTTVLGILRSSRIENPKLTIGFVGGDAASWMHDPAPMIESIFDTVEGDESEVVYSRGEPYMPLLTNKPMEECVQTVRPRKKPGVFMGPGK